MGLQSFIEKLTGTASGGIVALSRATLSTPAANVGRVYVPISGTVVGLDIWAPAGVIPGTWTFNFKKNGTPQFAGVNRMSISEANRHATKTGLVLAVTKDDLLTFDLEVAGPSPLFGPLQFSIIVDDGQELTTILAGPGIDIDNTDPDAPVISNTGVLGVTGAGVDNTDPQNPVIHGVLSVVAGDGIAVDNTDPNNPVVNNDGVIEIVGGAGIAIDNTDPQNPIVATTGLGASNSWDYTIVKPTTTSRQSNTTFAADPFLTFPIVHNQIYAYELWIWASFNTGSANMKFRAAFSQTPQVWRQTSQWISSSIGAGSSWSFTGSIFETNPASIATNIIGAANFFSPIQIKGFVQGHATNDGTFSFEWAQNSSVAVNSNIEMGSILSWKKA